jgi:hypothetical protein
MVVDTNTQRSPLRRVPSNEPTDRTKNQVKFEDVDPLDFLNPSMDPGRDLSPPAARSSTKRGAETKLDNRATKKGKHAKVCYNLQEFYLFQPVLG